MRVAVLGLGYVGVPLAASLAAAGDDVVGVDRVKEKVAALAAGRIPFEGEEPDLPALVSQAVAGGRLTATTDPDVLADVDTVVVAVETPLRPRSRSPDHRPLRSALRTVGSRMAPGTLVSVESTLAPGTMDTVVRPALERASGMRALEDFSLVHVPERLTAGKLLHHLTRLDRILGANDAVSRRRALALYRKFVKAPIHVTDWLTAEVVKTAENAYWDVQIAFANEVALLSEAYGVDAFEVRELVNTCPQRSMVFPGAGVGGHCIPKDPWLLVAGARQAARLIPAARAVNDAMPRHVVALAKSALGAAGRAVKGARICLLGFAFKGNTEDARNSPTVPIARALRRAGATVRIHDPYASGTPEFRVQKDLARALKGVDCVVLVAPHDEYRSLDAATLGRLMRRPVVVDGRNFFDPARLPEGFVYRGVGKGSRG